MAIAGLHNISVLDSSFLRESQSQASRRRGGDERRSTRASSVLQMWRELEYEHVVSHTHGRVSERLLEQGSDGLIADLPRAEMSDSHGSEHGGGSEDASVSENEGGQWSPNRFGSHNGHEDPSSFNYDRSSDLGVVERERVRHIFREWMNSGSGECTSNISRMNHSPRDEWLGETEQERVRIIREWMQMNSQQRAASRDNREEQATEMGGQIEQVLDGLVVNQNGRTEHIRRGIRRLCGRQALLDMLKNAERERQRELQDLVGHRAVSNFAHRNRIQSLLRGRFLRNDRRVEDERPTSTAASELGLLRQKHTVSGLRVGFFSRLSSHHSDTSSNATSSNSDINSNRNEQIHTNNLQETVDEFHEQSELNNDENASHGLSDGITDMGVDIVENISLQETTARIEEWQEQVSENEVREWQRSASVDSVEGRYITGQGLDSGWQGHIANELSHVVRSEASERSDLREAGEESYDQPQQSSEGSVIDTTENSEGNSIAPANGQEPTDHVENWQERVLENEERDWQAASTESNEWRDGTGEDMDEHQQELAANQWSRDGEHGHLQDGFQGAMQNWLEGPSDPEAFPVGRVDTLYIPDDDNVYSMELRELVSRRSVSTLLRSGFRESLDRLIQSYVVRQSHGPTDWELHETSATASAEQDLEQQNGEQSEGQGDAVESPPLALPSPPMPPIQPVWDQGSRHDSWPPQDMHHRFGLEWEIVNDLRIDMARLQQRMNNMQRMLEACMDMQLELQRSIRQEVSAALNRSADSSALCEDSLPKDGSQWDYVRKGVCCICCDCNIDTLLYRCGHMCTCSKCANELVQNGGKCPMCRAPVVEILHQFLLLDPSRTISKKRMAEYLIKLIN
ncbi:hypothetical protein QYF36_005732 [Acer negundo]|nr:hypothetical protein QYF36_005732 [Acer negundo]